MKYENKRSVLPLREYEIWKIQRTNNVTISGFFLANMKYENFFIFSWNTEHNGDADSQNEATQFEF